MNIAVIFAGGVGRRMHTRDLPKQCLQVYGKPIIIHTFLWCSHFVLSGRVDAYDTACFERCTGGKTRIARFYIPADCTVYGGISERCDRI